ncbi:MAG TPA: IPT/TIG domain-containing protein, partial [Phycisphaerae bacterium]
MRSAIRDSVVVALALAAPVLGQSLNVDIGRTTGAGAGAPSAAFGGAAEQPGVWNDITGTTTGPFTLVGLDGAPTGVTLTRSSGSGGSFGSNNPNTSGDYEKLLDDGQDVGGAGSSRIYTFNGLAAGAYVVYTYAVAPDNDTYISNVTVSGSPGPNPQGVGGVIPVDAFTAGITHAAHYVVLTSGAILTVTIATGSGFGTVNGFQLVGTSTVTLTSVDPPQHDFEGGSRIYVHGSGLSAGLEARINGETVANLTYIHPTLLTGLVPPNPVGTYDLVLRNPAAGVTLGVLPNAMQYVSAKLPPPEDVSAVRTAANTIKLAWSNPTINDSIQIKRNGALIATLPGNATEYNDILPFPPTSPTQYEMSSSSGARTSQIVLVRTTPYRDECLPFLGTGGSGRASGIWSAMIENFELQMCFHLENDAPALAIQVFAARVRAESQLKCRIRAFDAPHDVLGPAYDNIPVSSLELFRERYTQAILGQPLAAGDYLIGFYADPPSAAHQWAFELQL